VASIADEGIIPDVGIHTTEKQERAVIPKVLLGNCPEKATAELTGVPLAKPNSLHDDSHHEGKEKRPQEMMEFAESDIPSAAKDFGVIMPDEVFVEQEEVKEQKGKPVIGHDIELISGFSIMSAGILFCRPAL